MQPFYTPAVRTARHRRAWLFHVEPARALLRLLPLPHIHVAPVPGKVPGNIKRG